MRKPGDQIMTGDSVFFLCSNPATGRVKRISHKGNWADVEWDDGSGYRYTRRAKLEHIELLCPVLNQYMKRKKMI